jgi:hypothetical protein
MRAADVMLLLTGREESAARLREALDDYARDAGSGDHRAEVRLVPTGNSKGLRFSLDDQPRVIDTIVEWFDEVLPAGAGEIPPATPERSPIAIDDPSVGSSA